MYISHDRQERQLAAAFRFNFFDCDFLKSSLIALFLARKYLRHDIGSYCHSLRLEGVNGHPSAEATTANAVTAAGSGAQMFRPRWTLLIQQYNASACALQDKYLIVARPTVRGINPRLTEWAVRWNRHWIPQRGLRVNNTSFMQTALEIKGVCGKRPHCRKEPNEYGVDEGIDKQVPIQPLAQELSFAGQLINCLLRMACDISRLGRFHRTNRRGSKLFLTSIKRDLQPICQLKDLLKLSSEI